MFNNFTTETKLLSFPFLFWRITISLREEWLSSTELSPYDMRYYSLPIAWARMLRKVAEIEARNVTATGTLPETDMVTEIDVDKRIGTPRTANLSVLDDTAAEYPSGDETLLATHSSKTKICPYCGEEFEGLRSDAVYCCSAHRLAAWKENDAAKKARTG